MITQKEIDDLWYNQKMVPGVKFKLNDSVKIIDGVHKNECAAVISLLEIQPVPKYSVELGITGESFDVYESNLEAADETI